MHIANLLISTLIGGYMALAFGIYVLQHKYINLVLACMAWLLWAVLVVIHG